MDKTLKRGWLKKQVKQAVETINKYPKWLKTLEKRYGAKK